MCACVPCRSAPLATEFVARYSVCVCARAFSNAVVQHTDRRKGRNQLSLQVSLRSRALALACVAQK